MKMMHHKLQSLLLVVAALFFLLPLTTWAAEYLYHDLGPGKSADPIIEFTGEAITDPAKFHFPDFLTNTYPYHRLVVFYSPQCPHCIHFAPTYIDFARHFTNLTLDGNSIYAGLDVKYHAVSCLKYKKICRKQNANRYPTIYAFPAHQDHPIPLQQAELNPLTVLKGFAAQLVNDQWHEHGRNTKEHEQHVVVEHRYDTGAYYMSRTQSEIYGDAYLTFLAAMKDSVFLAEGPLPDTRRKALKQWLHLLQRVLPPWRLNWVVNELLDDFKDNTQDEHHWTAVLEVYPAQQKVWSPACAQHESPYTCGLWTLFHIMTVGVVEYNAEAHLEETKNHRMAQQLNAMRIQKTNDAAIFLREYVHHFFLCEECSTHFVQAFDACQWGRCHRLTWGNYTVEEWRELPLWLLEFHNGVNIRLQQERFQRDNMPNMPTLQQQQSVMWPPVQECPTCWTKVAGANSEYDKETMYKYLRLTYWPEDGKSLRIQQELQEAIANYEKNPSSTSQQQQQKPQLKQRQLQSEEQQSGGDSSLAAVESSSYTIVVGAGVCGVWLVVLAKKFHLDRLLGLHRAKMRTV